jgi:hypothetical protein
MPDGPESVRPSRFSRARIARLVIVVAVAALYFTLAPRWPKDNTVHIVLGPAASQVEEVRVGYALAPKHGPMAEDWTRGATFRFPGGSAPRIVTHEPRVADGDYVVEIEIVKASSSPPLRVPGAPDGGIELTIAGADAGAVANPGAIVRVLRRVTLEGGTTSIDVSEAAAEAAVTK